MSEIAVFIAANNYSFTEHHDNTTKINYINKQVRNKAEYIYTLYVLKKK